MNNKAEQYFKRYQEAFPEQKPAIAEEFQTFYDGLSVSEKASAEPFLEELRKQINQRIETLNSLASKAEEVLRRDVLHEN